MLSPSSTVAVTITTFVVRLAVAGITWVTVAMMASVVVERHGAPKGKMAEASMARYTGSIVSLALDGFTLKTSWFWILVPLQVVCAVLSQLSSTFLFSDFGCAVLPGFPVESSVKYDFNGSFNLENYYMNSMRAFSEEWQHFQPGTFESFAEHSRPENKIVGGAVDDTGRIWRTFLPLGAYDNKTNIHEYNGVARVVDSRIICGRPDMQTFGLHGMNTSIGVKKEWVERVRIDASSIPDVLHDGGDGVKRSLPAILTTTRCHKCTPTPLPIPSPYTSVGQPSRSLTTLAFFSGQPWERSGAVSEHNRHQRGHVELLTMLLCHHIVIHALRGRGSSRG